MALSFLKKPAAGGDDGNAGATKVSQSVSSTKTTTSSASSNSKAPEKKAGAVSFLKKGTDAKKAIAHEDAMAEQRKAEQGNLWAFWMPPNEDRTITFLDGELDEDGMLAVPVYHEHQLKINGDVRTYVCTADVDQSQPCPICERGDNRPSMVGLLTVIDHTPHKIQSGQNAGKTIQHTRKLFKAKMGTLKLLTKLAAKREGLTGCTFDVSRTGDKKPNVGDAFDFTKKWGDLDEVAAHYGLEPDADGNSPVAPANYEEEVVYFPPEKLIELGVGKKFEGIGTKAKNVDKKGLADQL